ncbi:hypothetical protein GZH49_02940 [Nocardia terpenica]|uniref:endonuclease/exonuclease/phosphatase family protein n=1 Tax=Nocardia terpenica TaxID=455432 RepID=UPI002FE30FB6
MGMREVRIGTWNLFEFGLRDRSPGEGHRKGRIIDLLRDGDVDVWCLQEFGSEALLRGIAAGTGMRCVVPTRHSTHGDTAYDPGAQGYGLGIMWRPRTGPGFAVEPVPDSLYLYSTTRQMYHGMVLLHLRIGGVELKIASTHLTPWGGSQASVEARRIVAAMTLPTDGPPAVLCSDSNTISADRDAGGSYHCPDPFASLPWRDSFVWQCTWRYDDQGRRIHQADRTAADILWSGGLHDSGAILGTAPTPTILTGERDLPAREIDHIRVTRQLAPAIRSCEVRPVTEGVPPSDHHPKITTIDLDAIPPPKPAGWSAFGGRQDIGAYYSGLPDQDPHWEEAPLPPPLPWL